VQAGGRLETWVKARWPDAAWLVEVPVCGSRAAGGSWTGVVDLLLLQPDGTAIVIDHKSVPVPEKMWRSKAAEFTGQLAAYAEALESAGLPVAEQWVHLPLGGGVVSLG
jgi:ATP-dependent exoDNAse (exonuclease V) beta subunit